MAEHIRFFLVEDDVAGYSQHRKRDDEKLESEYENRIVKNIEARSKDGHTHHESKEQVHPRQHKQSDIGFDVFARAELHESLAAAKVLFEIDRQQRHQLASIYVVPRHSAYGC